MLSSVDGISLIYWDGSKFNGLAAKNDLTHCLLLTISDIASSWA